MLAPHDGLGAPASMRGRARDGVMDASERELLIGSRLLCGMPPELVAELDGCCFEVDAADGDSVLRQGDPTTSVFVVIAGQIGISFDEGHATLSHRRFGAGECVGELSFIDGKVASANVTSLGASRLIGIPHSAMWRLVDRSHAVARNLLHIVSERMRHDNEAIVRVRRDSERFEHLATSDPLTGLRNRRWLEFQFPIELQRGAAESRDSSFLMMDIDGFKALNDTHGHAAGDFMLAHLARILAERSPRPDLVVRLGGEEFGALLPGLGADAGVALGERLREAIEQACVPVAGAREPVRVTVSVGVAAQSEIDGGGLEALMRAADAALYRAKISGRNRVCR